MWQSLSYGANYRAAYCLAVCPAGEDVIGDGHDGITERIVHYTATQVADKMVSLYGYRSIGFSRIDGDSFPEIVLLFGSLNPHAPNRHRQIVDHIVNADDFAGTIGLQGGE